MVLLLLALTTVAYKYSVSTFNFEQVFVGRVRMTGHNVLKKNKKRYICIVIKVARPILFNNLSLHRTEISYKQMTVFQL